MNRVSRPPSHVRGASSIAGFTPGGRPGLHGMIAFGDPSSGLFLSHIPMFHVPHDVQAVFPAELEGAPEDLSDDLFTFKPDDARMSLDDLVLGRSALIRGVLFRGNFEGDGQPIGKVVARVRSPLPSLTHPLGAAAPSGLTYVAFGRPEAAYLIHPVSQPPDFDHVLRCDLRQTGLTAEALRGGVALSIPGKANRVEERLRPGSTEATLADGRRVTIAVEKVLSTLVGPMFTGGPEQ